MKELLFKINSASPFLLSAARALGWITHCTLPKKAAPVWLVIRPGGMGDLIHAIDAFARFEKPQNALWLIEKRSEVWARQMGVPHLCYDRPGSWFKLLFHRFHTVINTEQLYALSQLPGELVRDRHTRVCGFVTHQASKRFDVTVPYDHDYGREDRQFVVLFQAAFPEHKPTADPQSVARQTALTEVVGLSGGGTPARELSAELWSAFIEKKLKNRPFILVYGPAETKLAEAVARRFAAQTQLAVRTFAETCRLIQSCAHFYGIDGGLVHVASHYRIPSTVIFTNGNYRKWPPLAAGSRIVRRTDLPCQPCVFFGRTPACPVQFACQRIDFNS